MTERSRAKPYELEGRTFEFTKSVIHFINQLPKTLVNREIAKQLIRSAGSVGANYIEANESLGKKDFAMKVKICRKEAKESRYWLRLVEANGSDIEAIRNNLVSETTELLKIFSAIIENTSHD